MRVGAQAANPLAFGNDLLPVVAQRCFIQPAFQEGARIDAGRRMGLEEDQIPALRGIGAAEEMLVANLEQVGRRGIARDVPAEFAMRLVGAHHHGERIPAQDGRQAPLHRQVAGIGWLRFHRHGVQVRRHLFWPPLQAVLPGMRQQRIQNGACALLAVLRAPGRQHAVERVAPLLKLLRIRLHDRIDRQGGTESVTRCHLDTLPPATARLNLPECWPSGRWPACAAGPCRSSRRLVPALHRTAPGRWPPIFPGSRGLSWPAPGLSPTVT